MGEGICWFFSGCGGGFAKIERLERYSEGWFQYFFVGFKVGIREEVQGQFRLLLERCSSAWLFVLSKVGSDLRWQREYFWSKNWFFKVRVLYDNFWGALKPLVRRRLYPGAMEYRVICEKSWLWYARRMLSPSEAAKRGCFSHCFLRSTKRFSWLFFKQKWGNQTSYFRQSFERYHVLPWKKNYAFLKL